MHIKITDDQTTTAGFISWYRLAAELFPAGGEVKSGEKIARMEISERGINYFLTFPDASPDR